MFGNINDSIRLHQLNKVKYYYLCEWRSGKDVKSTDYNIMCRITVAFGLNFVGLLRHVIG
jgi:hypothetical protein